MLRLHDNLQGKTVLTMRYLLYNIVVTALAPLAVFYLLCSRRHRALLRRFRPVVSVPAMKEGRLIWVHACSVGEVFVAKVLIRGLREHLPQGDILLTVSTLSGLEIARNTLPDIQVALAPMDLACSVRGFVKRVQPGILILLETELWPNLILETRKQGVPVMVVNGRISPGKFPKYRKYAWIMPPVYSLLNHVAAQEEIYRQRFVALGVPGEKVSVTGNLKCDGVITEVDEPRKEALRKEYGFTNSDRIVIFGSTRPGDEALAFACWEGLNKEYPDLRLVIAPRHLQRLEEGLDAFRGEKVNLRSLQKIGEGDPESRILFLDTMGELGGMYALCHAAVIGGSFFPGVEGHNPLEPAALGVPAIFGPYMGNFPDAATLLVAAGGAFQLASPDELAPLLRQLFDNPELGTRTGMAGCEAVMRNQGALLRSIRMIDELMK